MADLALGNSKIRQIAYSDSNRNLFTFSGGGESLYELAENPAEFQKKLNDMSWLNSTLENPDKAYLLFNNNRIGKKAFENKNTIKWIVKNGMPKGSEFDNINDYIFLSSYFTTMYPTIENNFTQVNYGNKKVGYDSSVGQTIFTTPKGCITIYNYGRYMGDYSSPYKAVIEVDGKKTEGSYEVVYTSDFVSKFEDIKYNIGITTGNAKWLKGTDDGAVSYATYRIFD